MGCKLVYSNIDVTRFGADIQIILREETTMKKLISVLLALCLALARQRRREFIEIPQEYVKDPFFLKWKKRAQSLT